MNLPLPRSRHGIFAGLILAIFFYGCYYSLPVQRGSPVSVWLFDRYQQFFHVYPTNNPTPAESDDIRKCILVEMRFPRLVSRIVPGWMYLRLTSQCTSKKSLILWVAVQDEDIIQLPSYISEEIAARRAVIEIAPQETVYVRLRLNTPYSDSPTLYYSDGSKSTFIQPVNAQISSYEAGILSRVLLETILLPPWANLFIPIMAFLFIYIAERPEDEEKPFAFCSLIKLLIFGLLQGFGLYLAINLLYDDRVVLWVVVVYWVAILLAIAASDRISLFLAKLPLLRNLCEKLK